MVLLFGCRSRLPLRVDAALPDPIFEWIGATFGDPSQCQTMTRLQGTSAMFRSLLPTTAAFVMMCQSVAFAGSKLVLISADPAVDATVRTVPTQVSITFNARVNAPFSTIVVLDERNQRLEKGLVEATSYAGKTMSIAVKPLTAGVYRVIWSAVSSDGSKTKGKYEFTVAAP